MVIDIFFYLSNTNAAVPNNGIVEEVKFEALLFNFCFDAILLYDALLNSFFHSKKS